LIFFPPDPCRHALHSSGLSGVSVAEGRNAKPIVGQMYVLIKWPSPIFAKTPGQGIRFRKFAAYLRYRSKSGCFEDGVENPIAIDKSTAQAECEVTSGQA